MNNESLTAVAFSGKFSRYAQKLLLLNLMGERGVVADTYVYTPNVNIVTRGHNVENLAVQNKKHNHKL